MTRELLALLSIWLLVVTTAIIVPKAAEAQDETEYFLDPATLPFDPLPGAENG